MIAITGATGQLGQHVLHDLLKPSPPARLWRLSATRRKRKRSASRASLCGRPSTAMKPPLPPRCKGLINCY